MIVGSRIGTPGKAFIMATQIHPTAAIHRDAVLGDDCDIGPYCCIGGMARIGSGARLHSHVVIDGNATVGDRCELFPFACIGQQTQDLKYSGGRGRVSIGAETTIREFVTVHMPTDADGLTAIGSNCHILAYCHIAHDCILGNRVIMSNSTNLGGHVIVEDAAVIGGMCGIHQFCRIGTMAMLGAMSKAVQDVAPYALADGNPAAPRAVNRIGMNRNRMNDEDIRAIAKAHRILFSKGLSQEAALDRLTRDFADNAKVMDLVTFAKASERGLARPKSKKGPVK